MMISRILNKTKINIQRSGWRAFAIIFMMTVTYVIMGLVLFVLLSANYLAQYFTQKPEIIGFFKDGITEEQMSKVKNDLENLSYVVDVKYISKEDALRSFIEKNQNKKDLIESITVNPFPAHLNVKVNTLDKINDVAELFRTNESIERTIASEKVIETLQYIVIGIQLFAIGLLSVLSIATFLIIFLTIGITIYSLKDEIIVMKLVGATNAFVRMPFILQSIFYGIVSSIIGSSIVIALAFLFRFNNDFVKVANELHFPVISPQILFIGIAIEVVFAILLSTISSYIATKRYISY